MPFCVLFNHKTVGFGFRKVTNFAKKYVILFPIYGIHKLI